MRLSNVDFAQQAPTPLEFYEASGARRMLCQKVHQVSHIFWLWLLLQRHTNESWVGFGLTTAPNTLLPPATGMLSFCGHGHRAWVSWFNALGIMLLKSATQTKVISRVVCCCPRPCRCCCRCCFLLLLLLLLLLVLLLSLLLLVAVACQQQSRASEAGVIMSGQHHQAQHQQQQHERGVRRGVSAPRLYSSSAPEDA